MINNWTKLTGKLPRDVVENAKAIAVKYGDGQTKLKTNTKDTLWKYNLSAVIVEYQIIN